VLHSANTNPTIYQNPILSLITSSITLRKIFQGLREKPMAFLNMIFTTFFEALKPASTKAKPTCIKITKIAAINTHKLLLYIVKIAQNIVFD